MKYKLTFKNNPPTAVFIHFFKHTEKLRAPSANVWKFEYTPEQSSTESDVADVMSSFNIGEDEYELQEIG